jgi:hypothetical protein
MNHTESTGAEHPVTLAVGDDASREKAMASDPEGYFADAYRRRREQVRAIVSGFPDNPWPHVFGHIIEHS